MRKGTFKMILWSVIAALGVILDQLAKYLVAANINSTQIVEVLPGLVEFVYVKNTGAAFNILSGKLGFLSIISVLFSIGVVIYMFVKKPQSKLFKTALLLLVSGAVGNAIDRIFRGFVVDFIRVEFIDFPVFNIADIFITVGAVLYIVYLLFFDNKKE